MKQKRTIKLLLIIAIILIACCIKTTSYAISYEWDNFDSIVGRLIESSENSVVLNRNLLYQNNHIFCREKGNVLSSNVNYFLETKPIKITIMGENYEINKNPLSLPNNQYTFGDELAYLLAEVNAYSKDTLATEAGDVQKALWCLLGQYEYDELTDAGKEIYDSAISYGLYRDSVKTGVSEGKYLDDTDLSDGFSNIDYLKIEKSNPEISYISDIKRNWNGPISNNLSKRIL